VVTIGPEKRSSGIGQPAEGAHRQEEFCRPSAMHSERKAVEELVTLMDWRDA